MDAQDPLCWIGSTLEAKYRIDGFVGEGGFGFVYRGKHLTLGNPIAVKFLKPASAASSQRRPFLKRFLAEGRLLHDLSRATAGIVQAMDTGAAVSPSGEWTPFIVMEWVDGRTLADELLAHPRRSVFEALSLLEPVFEALSVAHEMGVAHRDLKPSNLMICQIGTRRTVKVLDFGIAKVMGDARDASSAVTAPGEPRMFSVAYGAPEQFEPALGATGPWTDVYALALVLAEVVDGAQVYRGDGMLDCRAQALDRERRPTLAMDRSLDAVLRRALAVDPRNRYPSAREFHAALRSAVVRLPAIAPGPRSVTAEEPQDMIGNVREWTTSEDGSAGWLMGGGWDTPAVNLGKAYTPRPGPPSPNGGVSAGVRCVR